jgi:hypothetical protein
MRTRYASRLTTRVGIVLLTAALAYWGTHQSGTPASVSRPETSAAWQQSDDPLLTAYLARSSHVQIESEGVIERLLPDDNDGSRHQRFILKGPSGQTVLVAHNIDLAPRVEGLEVGAPISFSGEYEWNERGGVLHWTHHAPRNDHIDGWLDYRGRRYQ